MNVRFEIIWFAKDKHWRVTREDGDYRDVKEAKYIPQAMQDLYEGDRGPIWGEK